MNEYETLLVEAYKGELFGAALFGALRTTNPTRHAPKSSGHDALPPFLSNFVRLRTLAPDPSDPALVALVTHEQAINAFAELELAGKSDRSIAVLQWHLETVAP